MSQHGTTSFLRHARTFAFLTLISRFLGLIRDAIIVRTLGVSGLGTAFNIAFQFPNTFRRLFGEGALSAAFIPEYAQLIKHQPDLAHRFASLTTALLTVALTLLVLFLEVILLTVYTFIELPDDGRRAILYLAIMLPYMPLICITAAFGGMLQTHGRFAAQAGAPIILNLCMIAAAATFAFIRRDTAENTALAISIAVTIAGFLQLAWCLIDLRHHIQWTRQFDGASPSARRMFARMGPVILGLGTIQIATLIESWVIVAWPLYMGPTILGHPYPLDEAAGSALYNAQRLYQFPLGIFGIALATAVFPLLARLADEKNAFADTLRRAIRLAAFIGIPATIGLIWVARDLTAVVYLGGKVTADDAARMAHCLIMYAPLVGAYSLTHVLVRAFYAKGDTKLPTRISIITVLIGLALGTILMWPFAERGLALAASIAAFLQFLLLIRAAQNRLGSESASLFDHPTTLSIIRTFLCCMAMLALLTLIRLLWPQSPEAPYSAHLLHLARDVAAGGLAFIAASAFLCRTEIRWLIEKKSSPSPNSVGDQ